MKRAEICTMLGVEGPGPLTAPSGWKQELVDDVMAEARKLFAQALEQDRGGAWFWRQFHHMVETMVSTAKKRQGTNASP